MPPIIVTILLDAITVVLAAVLYVLISSLTTGGANTVPIGGAFGFGTAAQASGAPASACASGHACYSVGISSAGSSATTANIKFAVQSGGVAQTFTSVALMPISGTTALACFVSGSWYTTCAAATALTSAVGFASTDNLIVDTGATSFPGGWVLYADGVSALQGQTSVALP